MQKGKQNFYSCQKIKNIGAEYNIIFGERSNGKSYSVKHELVKQAIENPGNKFIFLRRWDMDFKFGLTESYFNDLNFGILYPDANGVSMYKRELFLSNISEGKITRLLKIGYARSLVQEEHYTSGVYNDTTNVLFEEMVSRSGYLPREPEKLMHFISTVARRRKITVWMIGNTISRLCPYFSEWELRGIPKQKQGTIDIYEHKTDEFDEEGNQVTVKLAVEFAENSGRNSKMFFGNTSKMINTGAWSSDVKPHLPERIEKYNLCYTIVVQYLDFKFLCKFLSDLHGNYFWYVEPKTTEIKNGTRLVTDRVLIDNLSTCGLIALTKNEVIAFEYLKNRKIFYSDNLTGTDFETCLNALQK